MHEPIFFGLPLSWAFLYFITYSVLGWCMETVYCSILEKRWVSRGFLFGPMCPIYGVGVLMMICWFQPLMDRPVLFYVTATVCMSAWEYLVGWFLETTTHIKYWDYSMYRFNLHGRICLWVCLMWGVLSFLVLYFIHPFISGHLDRIPTVPRYVLDGFLCGVLVTDAAATIYQLVRTSQLLGKLQRAGEELQLQLALGRAEFADMLSEATGTLADQLDDILPSQLTDAGRAAKVRYDELMASLEIVSRRFRGAYSTMRTSGPANQALENVKRRGEQVKTLFKGVLLKNPDREKRCGEDPAALKKEK